MKEKIIKLVVTVVLFIGFIVSSVLYFCLGANLYSLILFVIFAILDVVIFLLVFKSQKKFENIFKSVKKENKEIKINKANKSLKIIKIVQIVIAVVSLILCAFLIYGIVIYVNTEKFNLVGGIMVLLITVLSLSNYFRDLYFDRVMEYKLYTLAD